MKSDKLSAIIGVMLVFVMGAVFLAFCKVSDENAPERTDWQDKYDDYGYEDDDPDPDVLASLEQRGYVVSRQMPECLQKLIDTNLFAVTEEKIKEAEYDYFDGYEGDELYKYYAEEYYDEDEEEEYSPEEIAQMVKEDIKEDKQDIRTSLKEGYEYALKKAAKYGETKYIQKNNDLFVTSDEEGGEDEEILYCLLKWDTETGMCQDAEKVAMIEGCGFQGFSDLISEVEQRLKDDIEAQKDYAKFNGNYDEDDEDDEGYYISDSFSLYCQGITFLLYGFSSTNHVTLEVKKNNSTYYIPARYKNIIDGIESDGSYFLSSSYVAGGKDVLVFSRDNTVGLDLMPDYEGRKSEERKKYSHKRLVFIFEDGKLIDYYMASKSDSMKLDDVDKKVLDSYVSGLGKTLSGMPESVDGQTYLYRAQ